MVMKGGITSGVVYPGAIRVLADKYKFRQIGGASAGAIAAAAAAACELGRKTDPRAFEALDELPGDLGKNMANRLQPSEDLKPIWTFAMAQLEKSGGQKRANLADGTAKPVKASVRDQLGLVAGVVGLAYREERASFEPPILLAIAVGALLGWLGGPWAWVLAGVLIAIGCVVGALLGVKSLGVSTLRYLDNNGFGFCDGQTSVSGAAVDPLTPWLSECFNRWAHLKCDGEVLTFGHLWGAAATEAYRDAAVEDEQNPPARAVTALREIDLQMMTTNLSMRRPYQLPFDARIFFWCEECLSAYLGADVLAHMRGTGEDLEDRKSSDGVSWKMVCPRHPEMQLRRLPLAPDFPVVLAVRMSLSFPILFSAVPLHTIDWSRSEGNRGPKIVWFADGGATSNFPMHFFDSMWPTRPTFGITLGPENPDHPGVMVHRAKDAGAGMALHVTEFNSLMDRWQPRFTRCRTGPTTPWLSSPAIETALSKSGRTTTKAG